MGSERINCIFVDFLGWPGKKNLLNLLSNNKKNWETAQTLPKAA